MSKSRTNARILIWYSFLILNISFLLALLYGHVALAFQQTCETCGSNFLLAFEALKDSPSVWCVFAGMHALLLPTLFKMIKKYDLKAGFKIKKVPTIKLMFIAALVWGIMFLANTPILFGVGLKMVTH